jgi:hypothetical protein
MPAGLPEKDHCGRWAISPSSTRTLSGTAPTIWHELGLREAGSKPKLARTVTSRWGQARPWATE